MGQGWVLLGYEADPSDALTEAQRGQLDGFTDQLCAPGGDCDEIDVEGTSRAWHGEIEAIFVLIRPDFYVALTAGSADTLQARSTRS